jgi:hypothetical protein
MIYEQSRALNTFGPQVEFNALAAPASVAVSPVMGELLRNLTDQLGLKQVAVYTPWATQQGDLDWQEISRPDTNVAVFAINDPEVNKASELMFGAPLPFLTILTPHLITRGEAEAMLLGSPYEFYETQAVYNQGDSKVVPSIKFLHWVRRLDIGEGGNKSMSAVADSLHGLLMFAQQVPVEGSTIREIPPTSFDEALRTQLGPIAPEPGPIPGPGPVPVPPSPLAPVSAKSAWVGLLLVAGAVGVGTFLIGRAVWK